MRVRGPVAFLLNFASTIAKFLIRQRKPPSQSSGTSLNDHGQDLVAVDFFAVSTIDFRVLFVFRILAHDRRRCAHFNVTKHPISGQAPSKTTIRRRSCKALKYLLLC
jgi:hypothetical protein